MEAAFWTKAGTSAVPAATSDSDYLTRSEDETEAFILSALRCGHLNFFKKNRLAKN